ncbi:Lrp/AsnC family transcriptional regulator [Mycolicibacterium fortuitum]|uniref:Lrp/AsnC family transcriptional regulator n=1 Tax=Mycolicibacterium fortuitum TaxID=1766 RepID=UPI0033B5F161
MPLDPVDREIIELLRQNARTPVSQIARQVGLSTGPVSRRIARLERTGVIKGYVAVVDEQAVGGIDAFSEVRLIGSIDTSEIEAMARNMPEIKEVYTVSGDPDALIRVPCRKRRPPAAGGQRHPHFRKGLGHQDFHRAPFVGPARRTHGLTYPQPSSENGSVAAPIRAAASVRIGSP